MNPLLALRRHGQSFWLDNLTRPMLRGDELKRLVEDKGLSGVTSNPAIFEKAIAGSKDYDPQIRDAVARGMGVAEVYRELVVGDVREACDLLRGVFEESGGADGFVSLEVSPHLAHDSEGTLAEARALWAAVGRANLMIKVPGTPAGMGAIEALLFEGVNVNVTLLFGIDAWGDSFDAYQRALERRLEAGRLIDRIASVASFFLSRIDVLVDRLLAQRMHGEVSPELRERAAALRGRAAAANARLAYREFRRRCAQERWQHLAGQGARPQRVLWASTGTKKPDQPPAMYVEPLIGPDTVSTMPDATAQAFAAQGRVAATVEAGVEEAEQVMRQLADLGIDFHAVTAQLAAEGVQKFIDPYDALLAHLAERCDEIRAELASAPLQAVAQRLRRDVLRMTTEAGSGHPTSCLSCAEIIAALFFHEMRWDPHQPSLRNVDGFILSKGHAAPILWAGLAEAGAIEESLTSLRRLDSSLKGHPTPNNPWVRVATGSLGQGLSAANGIALANRLDGIDGRVYCLMGDGECSEGSVWEAAQFAAEQGLEGLTAVVDMNGLQQSGPAPTGGDTARLARRFEAFGWRTLEIDGHDIPAVLSALRTVRQGGPWAILARTIKGKGVSFLEGAEGMHGKALDPEQLAAALAEIGEHPVPLRVTPRRVPRAVAPSPLPYTGMPVEYAPDAKVSTRAAFGNALTKLGERMPRLVVLDGDVKNSTKTEAFAADFPDRFFECNIAEQNMIGTALGLAVSGRIPCAASFSAFLTRGFDFIRMAAHSRPPHLVLCGSHAGVSIGEDGPSQMGLEDIAMFRALDGTTILYPSDAVSAERLTELAMLTRGIVYLRTTRSGTPILYRDDETFAVGGSKTLVSSERDQLTLVAAGITVHEALRAQEMLLRRGVRARVIDAYSVKPLDVSTLQQAADETGTLPGGRGSQPPRRAGRGGQQPDRAPRAGVPPRRHRRAPLRDARRAYGPAPHLQHRDRTGGAGISSGGVGAERQDRVTPQERCHQNCGVPRHAVLPD